MIKAIITILIGFICVVWFGLRGGYLLARSLDKTPDLPKVHDLSNPPPKKAA